MDKSRVLALFLIFFVTCGFVSVPPETLTHVEMSNTDVNRLVCSGEVKDVVFSKEKGLNVKVLDNSVFIKFPVAKQGGKDVYSSESAEIFVVCGESIYTVMGVPKKISSVTVQMASGSKGNMKKNTEIFKGLALEEKILKLLTMAYIEEYPDSLSIEKFADESVKSEFTYNDVDLFLRRKVAVEGEGITLYEYVLTPQKSMEMREVDFMPLAKKPIAIALETTLVEAGKRYRLFVVDSTIGK